MNVVGYARVSTDDKSSQGMSIEVQVYKIRLYCELHGLNLVSVVTDVGESGKTLYRRGWIQVRNALDSKAVEGVVIAKLDRLSRSVADWNTLIERYFGDRAGYQLFSVSDSIDTRTAAGRLVLNVLMSVAQWERETIVERTKAVLDHKRHLGERVGEVPYGSRLAADGIHLESCPEDLVTAAEIHRLRADGRSLRQVAADMQARGIPPKRGGKWSHTSVVAILRSFPCPPAEPPTSSPTNSAAT